MEQIPSEQYHVDLAILGQTHNLVKCLPRVVAPRRVLLIVADMVVCSYEYTDCIRLY